MGYKVSLESGLHPFISAYGNFLKMADISEDLELRKVVLRKELVVKNGKTGMDSRTNMVLYEVAKFISQNLNFE